MKIVCICIVTCIIFAYISIANSLQSRIVGGQDMENENSSYLVFLEFDCPGLNRTFCGGVYIAPGWVLTSAHCIKLKCELELIMELRDMRNKTGIQKRKPAQIIVHPQYSNAGLFRKDIALVKTDTDFDTSEDIDIATLPRKDTIYDGYLVTIVGWGNVAMRPQVYPNKVQVLDVHVWKRYLCGPSVINKDVFCAGELGQVGCYGDNGGPAIFNDMVIGIASHIMPVDRGTCASPYAVYENVHRHLRWIQKHVPDVATSKSENKHINVNVMWLSSIVNFLLLASGIFDKNYNYCALYNL